MATDNVAGGSEHLADTPNCRDSPSVPRDGMHLSILIAIAAAAAATYTYIVYKSMAIPI